MSKSEELAAKLAKNIPQEVIVKNATAVAATSQQQPSGDLEDDYEYSRERYKALVDKGTEAIDHMMELALQSDHPRAFEVLGGMLKNVSDMTDKLVALHGTVEKVKAAKTAATQGGFGSSTPSVTNNTSIFVGSTTELQRFIIAQQQQNVIDATPSNKE